MLDVGHVGSRAPRRRSDGLPGRLISLIFAANAVILLSQDGLKKDLSSKLSRSERKAGPMTLGDHLVQSEHRARQRRAKWGEGMSALDSILYLNASERDRADEEDFNRMKDDETHGDKNLQKTKEEKRDAQIARREANKLTEGLIYWAQRHPDRLRSILRTPNREKEPASYLLQSKKDENDLHFIDRMAERLRGLGALGADDDRIFFEDVWTSESEVERRRERKRMASEKLKLRKKFNISANEKAKKRGTREDAEEERKDTSPWTTEDLLYTSEEECDGENRTQTVIEAPILEFKRIILDEDIPSNRTKTPRGKGQNQAADAISDLSNIFFENSKDFKLNQRERNRARRQLSKWHSTLKEENVQEDTLVEDKAREKEGLRRNNADGVIGPIQGKPNFTITTKRQLSIKEVQTSQDRGWDPLGLSRDPSLRNSIPGLKGYIPPKTNLEKLNDLHEEYLKKHPSQQDIDLDDMLLGNQEAPDPGDGIPLFDPQLPFVTRGNFSGNPFEDTSYSEDQGHIYIPRNRSGGHVYNRSEGHVYNRSGGHVYNRYGGHVYTRRPQITNHLAATDQQILIEGPRPKPEEVIEIDFKKLGIHDDPEDTIDSSIPPSLTANVSSQESLPNAQPPLMRVLRDENKSTIHPPFTPSDSKINSNQTDIYNHLKPNNPYDRRKIDAVLGSHNPAASLGALNDHEPSDSAEALEFIKEKEEADIIDSLITG
ncbi:hypothetical protein AAMO2058_000400800, partial [Amorphochlora amoebiformis]